MKPPVIQRTPHYLGHRRQERGVTMLLVAIAMIGILALAALSIDVVTLYLARSEAQRAADAGALAGARVLSLSGVTGDPANTSVGTVSPWPTVCTLATQVSQSVARQNTVGGTAPPAPTVTFVYNGTTQDCSSPPPPFAVNPQVKVQVQRTSLPTFFARIWSSRTNTVTATATAEVFNPSGSGALLGTIVPVQPRCVKPWTVPNVDPGSGATKTSLVNATTGDITTKGFWSGTPGSGEVGESFSLFADCGTATPCVLQTAPPTSDVTAGTFNGKPAPAGNNLEYLPAQVPSASTAFTAVPSCGAGSDYQKAVAGCDQTTVYQCGVATANTVDLSVNPGGSSGDSAVATQCLIHQATLGPAPPDADSLDTTAFPFRVTAGTGNPLIAVQGNVVSSSTSIVSLPIYDSTAALTFSSNTAPVTIVGFLQVFINYVNTDGTLNVTVLNVVGCGKGTPTPPGTAVTGSSPVPARLITPP